MNSVSSEINNDTTSLGVREESTRKEIIRRAQRCYSKLILEADEVEIEKGLRDAQDILLRHYQEIGRNPLTLQRIIRNSYNPKLIHSGFA